MATGEVDPSTNCGPFHPRGFWWGVLGLVASLVGVQSLVASGANGAQVLMLLPANGPVSGVGDGLRRGYGLAMAEAVACGVIPPLLELGWLPIGEDPRPFLLGRSLPRLLIAPPAAPSLPYGLVAKEQNINVLLPFQRGSSLQRLPSQPGADRLWPVLPGRIQEADQLARALVQQSRDKTMVIHDGNGELVALADRFTETLSGAGGWVVGPANESIGIAKPTKSAMDQLLDDIRWYQPESVVVMTSPGSPLAKAVASSALPASLTLVWPFPVKIPLRNPQVGVEPISRGPGWSRFEQAFERRHGFKPGLVEAAGYDTGQLAVLAAAGTASKGGWQLDWLDPRSKPLGLCAALQARAKGSGLAIKGASSRLDLSTAIPPTGEVQLIVVKPLPLAAGP